MVDMSMMMDNWYLFLILPIAFIHGWWTGRSRGVEIGANGMYDVLVMGGKEIPGKKGVVMVELEVDKEDVLLSKNRRRF